LYQNGINGEDGWQSWQLPTSLNPYINPAEIEAAKRDLPEIIFRQEYLAEFIDDQGGVFRRVQDAAVGVIDEPEDGRQYIAGVDVAASIDYTVVTVMDVEDREMVYMDRFNRVDYPVLIDRLAALYEKWHLDTMVIEANSIGRPVIDHMIERNLAIVPFTTTSATKQTVIQGLQSAFEHGNIKIINDPVLIGELLSFEGKRNASGSFSYSAPDGMHDDCVMSLALAWDGCTSNNRWAIY
jgi:phage terminase large subunit-like protein